MMKYKIVCLSVVALIGLAAGQSSKTRSSSARSDSDPVKAATKPLTPKSAMPSHRRPVAAAPKPATNRSKTTAELTHLERGQNLKTGGSNSSSTALPKSPSAKSTATPARSGSGIDFKYQKPVAQKPATPGAHSQGSSTPEVTKQN